MISHEKGKWVLRTKDGSKVLGSHETEAEALEQEQAIEASKHKGDSKTVRRYERFDITQDALAKPEVTQEGFWRVEGRVARAGVQEYRRADGTRYHELRKPDDVKRSVPGFALAPLTNTHPAGMVTPHNAKQHVSGAVGEAKFDGTWVTAPLTIYDAETIAAVKAGRAQLSAGYSCELIEEAGEWEGQKYDCRQSEITINHVAIVDIARAGPEASIRLDGRDAVCGEFRPYENHMIGSRLNMENAKMPHKFKLDGLDVEVADANTQAIIEKVIAEAKADGEAKAKELAELKVKHDVLEASNKTLKEENSKLGQLSTEKGLALAMVIDNAREILGKNVKVDGGELDIMSQVIKKILPGFKLDALDESAIRIAYRAALAAAPQKPTALDLARTAGDPIKTDDAMNPHSARERMIARNRAALVK